MINYEANIQLSMKLDYEWNEKCPLIMLTSSATQLEKITARPYTIVSDLDFGILSGEFLYNIENVLCFFVWKDTQSVKNMPDPIPYDFI